MSKTQKHVPSSCNTTYDKFPEGLSFLPSYLSLWLLEVLLMMIGGGILVSMIVENFFLSTPWAGFAGVIIVGILISTPNFVISYGYAKFTTLLRSLCLLYIVASIPHFYFDHIVAAFIPIVIGVSVLWIIGSDQFRLFLYHRIKLGEWRRGNLKVNSYLLQY